jgi:OOP family OmpA-OmpF porin
MAKSSTTKKVVITVGVLALIGLGIYLYKKYRKPKENIILKDAFDNLVFEINKDIIKPESFPFLDELADVLSKAKDWKLSIVGHTDNVGSDKLNLDLSKRRANAVKNYLVAKGILDASITTDGKGESMPIASNDTPDGRSRNRRVEFTIIKPDNSTITTQK